jgi:hypothetical protein
MSSKESLIIESQIADPKSSLGCFELPCGLLLPDGTLVRSVKVREITGVEEDMLASKKTPPTKKMGELLTGCTLAIGEETDPKELRKLVSQLLVGDRVFLLLSIRRVSLGEIYPFKEKCPQCEVISLYDIDLSTLETKQMVDPTKRSYEVVTSKGTTVRWHPMDGLGEERLSVLQTEEDKITLALLVRIDMIGDQPPSIHRIKKMGMRERTEIRDSFQEAEGGVDTTMEFTCPKCNNEFKGELDIGQQGFFFPSAVKKDSK